MEKIEVVEKLTDTSKKNLLKMLKKCARYYKENLIGKEFLILYNQGNYKIIKFTKKEFKHMTGVSSHLGAKRFFDSLTKKGATPLRINDIYTTTEHPHHLALKKMSIFESINQLFSEKSFLLTDVETKTRVFKLGLSDLELTMLCNKYRETDQHYATMSLRTESLLVNAREYYFVDFVFCRENNYFKFSKLVFPKKININYFKKNRKSLEFVIDYSVLGL